MKSLGQIVKFGIVGSLASVTHYCVGVVIYYVFDWGLGALTVNFMAFSVAFMVTYFGNTLFVFPGTPIGITSFRRILSVSLFSFALNQGIVYLMTVRAGVPFWQTLIVAIMVVPPVTFTLLKFWGVRVAKPPTDRGRVF